MADPVAYDIDYSFANFQATAPDTPLPGSALDNELENIETAIADLVAGLIDVRAADGTLKAGVVTPGSLSSDFITPVPPATAWATTTAYAVDDAVFESSKLYICLIAHTSGVFATDLAALKWSLLADFAPVGLADAADIVYDPATSNMAAADVQAAIDEIDGRVDVLEAGGAVVLASLASDVTIKLLPYGAVMDFGGAVAPSGWLLCYGQAVSRTIYASLFAAISTTHGTGNGSTTFNLPDCRGRVAAGKDDMGGTSANRLTGLTGGVDGDDLGDTGGAETHALSSGQNGAHSHTATASSENAHRHFVFADDTVAGADNLGVASQAANVTTGGEEEYTITAGGADATVGRTSNQAAHDHDVTVSSSGSGTAHNNVQPTIVLNKIIFAGV